MAGKQGVEGTAEIKIKTGILFGKGEKACALSPFLLASSPIFVKSGSVQLAVHIGLDPAPTGVLDCGRSVRGLQGPKVGHVIGVDILRLEATVDVHGVFSTTASWRVAVQRPISEVNHVIRR